MRRYYHIDVQPNLFGGFGVIREWGRIGQRGRIRHDPHLSEAEATAALQRLHDAKRRRGYRCDTLDR
jgi:predicted DNA-binding WGR domain protein